MESLVGKVGYRVFHGVLKSVAPDVNGVLYYNLKMFGYRYRFSLQVDEATYLREGRHRYYYWFLLDLFTFLSVFLLCFFIFLSLSFLPSCQYLRSCLPLNRI